jgi:diguanylate cyclase (GGDEF)-like protein
MLEIPESLSWSRRAARLIPKILILGSLVLLYYVAGRLGLGLAFVNPSTTAVWPPSGIALAAFLLLGNYSGIGIFIGAFLVNIAISGSVPSSLAIAIGNTLEGFIGATLINRFAHGTRVFDKATDVFKFALFTGLISTVVSATIGTTSIVLNSLAPASDYATIWLTWWLGDAGGTLILAPALVLFATKQNLRWNARRLMEFIFLVASALLIAVAVFGFQSIFAERHYPLEFMFVPVIIWAAYRFGQRETATVTLLFSSVAILGTLKGLGPFVEFQTNESLLLLQSFMMTAAVTGLGLAALVSERRAAEAELQDVNQKLIVSLDSMENHNNKMLLLNEMGDLLQSCKTFEEAYSIIGQLGGRLLPEESGVLYIINNSQNHAEAVVTWGTSKAEPDFFALDECWALRRGKSNILHFGQNGLELVCPHIMGHPSGYALCILMMAQGESMGILHIRNRQGDDTTALTESKKQIATAMAESMGLALANLKLRLFLREQSIRDALTGLFNRRYLDETLEREFHRAMRTQRQLGVMMLDLDHFKRFNDTYGHGAGDVLLKNLGTFLKQHLRGGDIACRYGGEEFILILPEASLENVLSRAEQLREGIKHLKAQYKSDTLPALTLSIGVAMFPYHGETSQQVLSAADDALYMAKREGRDQVVVSQFEQPEKSSEFQ